ncbi:MAG: Rossmann-like domain-containing protein [Promethearchaeota archaeon]
MSITSDFLTIVDDISKKIPLPSIKEIVIPRIEETTSHKKSNFAAIVLNDNSIGLSFINLTSEVKSIFHREDFEEYKWLSPQKLAQEFHSKDLFKKSLGMGAINAISQYFFKKTEYFFDYAIDSLGLLEIKDSDTVGMVGFFPPLVKQIEQKRTKLIVIEKKKHLVQKTANWLVTLDPSKLEECNKILITGTTVLNETIDEILDYCSNADKISIIGPTAGFLPDPLFARGIDVIGGSIIIDPFVFVDRLKNNKRWGDSVKKYTITKQSYLNYTVFLDKLKDNSANYIL